MANVMSNVQLMLFFLAGMTLVAIGYGHQSFFDNREKIRVIERPVESVQSIQQIPGISVVLERIVSVVMQDDASGYTVRFRDFGTLLDNVLTDDATFSDAHWTYMIRLLVNSFPGRDLTETVAVFNCYRAYRLALSHYLHTNVDRDDGDALRYSLRVHFFGDTVADTLFATEHGLLFALGSGDMDSELLLYRGDSTVCQFGDRK